MYFSSSVYSCPIADAAKFFSQKDEKQKQTEPTQEGHMKIKDEIKKELKSQR